MEKRSHSNFQSENNTLEVRYIGKVVLGISDLINFIVIVVILGGEKAELKIKLDSKFWKAW